VGIDATAEPGKLRESQAWQTRQAGTPDILISAANEDNVRYDIENGYPPIQVFGTTGKNWQSAVMTFVPLSGVCTCCLFPPEKPADTECATAPSEGADSEEQVDAALPFLSFAAGLMTAIELAKIGMEGWPFAEDRALFQPLSDEVVVGAQMTHRGGCICENLHASVHKAMVSGSKFDGLGAS
jgi:hypothetical protein